MSIVEVDLIKSLALGAVSSLVASLIFLFALRYFRPKIIISDRIAKKLHPDGRLKYHIKIINKTRFPIMDLRAELTLEFSEVVPGEAGDKVRRVVILPLSRQEIFFVDQYRGKGKGFSRRFTTHEDLEALWQEHDKAVISFKIYAVHSLTGLGAFYRMNYENAYYAVIAGDFEYGNSVEIVNV